MKILEAIFVALLCFTLSFTQNDIRMPPSIILHPLRRSVIYRSDESVTLNCKGTGVPNVTYEWKKNDFILNQKVPNIQRGADGTITIQPATSLDEGFYQCFAKNQYGTALSITTHIQRAFLESASGAQAVLQKIVQEGMPFHVDAHPRRSFPKPIYGWEFGNDTVDKKPAPIRPSKRIQMSENGNLHFSYALREDDLGGRIYKCTTYNPYLDVKAGGSYTKLTVTRNAKGITQSAPTLAFSSEVQIVALVGERVILRCFFYGYPQPAISWIGPGRTIPTGRYVQNSFSTELTINNLTASDEGEYRCRASNAEGHSTHTLQMRVEAAPKFQNTKDGPFNVNVTEGESVTYKCNVFAKPQANIVWLQNGQPIDSNNPPKRFVVSSDRKSLTIRDVCRDCVDRESKTDLMVIQCNASNVHGYVFASGYLNVLIRTKVSIASPTFLSVDHTKENWFQLNCSATSDPSTPPRVQWYKVGNQGQESVNSEPPYVNVTNGYLSIYIEPNCSTTCDKYFGEYRCIGDNGYSRESATVSIGTIGMMSSAWRPILLILFIVLVLFTVGIIFGLYRKRVVNRKRTLNSETAIFYPKSGVYEEIGYESIDALREEVASKERPTFRADSMYEYPGYESLNLPVEERRTLAEIDELIEQSSDFTQCTIPAKRVESSEQSSEVTGYKIPAKRVESSEQSSEVTGYTIPAKRVESSEQSSEVTGYTIPAKRVESSEQSSEVTGYTIPAKRVESSEQSSEVTGYTIPAKRVDSSEQSSEVTGYTIPAKRVESTEQLSEVTGYTIPAKRVESSEQSSGVTGYTIPAKRVESTEQLSEVTENRIPAKRVDSSEQSSPSMDVDTDPDPPPVYTALRAEGYLVLKN